MYSVMVLFFVLAGMAYKEEKELKNTAVFGLIAFFIYIVLQAILISNIFVCSNQFALAIQTYPLNKQAYGFFITERIQEGDSFGAVTIADQYERIAPDDENIVRTLAETYLTLGDKKKALFYFERMYKNNHLVGISIIRTIYELKKETESDKEAKKFVKNMLLNYKKNTPYWYKTQTLKKQIKNFCKQYKEEKTCKQAGWKL